MQLKLMPQEQRGDRSQREQKRLDEEELPRKVMRGNQGVQQVELGIGN
jgi:hypothetical protein